MTKTRKRGDPKGHAAFSCRFCRCGPPAAPGYAAPAQALHPVDEEGGDGDGDEGKQDALEGDVAQRQRQHRQIGEKVGAGQPPAGDVGDGEGQSVVAASGTALADDKPHAHTHEQRAGQRRRQRMGRQVRQHGRKLLPHLVPAGHRQRGDDGVADEAPTQKAEGQKIAQKVQHRRDVGRGDGKPVLDEQHQADDAALGDGGALVDVVDAEGVDGRAQRDDQHLFGRPGRGLLFVRSFDCSHFNPSLFVLFSHHKGYSNYIVKRARC